MNPAIVSGTNCATCRTVAEFTGTTPQGLFNRYKNSNNSLSQYLSSFKLSELKPIFKTLKLISAVNGYEGNKPQIVDCIDKALKRAYDTMHDPQAVNFSQEQTTTPSTHIASTSNNINTVKPHPVSTSSNTVTKTTPKPLTYQQKVLNTPAKEEIFRQVCRSVPGIGANEVLNAISSQSNNGSMLNSEIIIRGINQAREKKRLDEEAYIKRMEDAEFDRAVIESEQQRDLEKARKRQKLEDLRVDARVSILKSGMFTNSVLLKGMCHIFPHLSNEKVLNIDSSGSLPLSNVLQGCRLIQLIVALCEDVTQYESNNHNHSSSSSSSSSSSIANNSKFYGSKADEKRINNLRKVVVDLLYREIDAVKYYKDAAYPQLLRLAHNLDSLLLTNIKNQVNFNNFKPTPLEMVNIVNTLSSGTVDSVRCSDSATLEVITNVQDTLYRSMSNEHYKFSKGLSRLPRDGQAVPDIFRSKKLLPFITMIKRKVDEDGFEFVDESDGLVLLSDDSDMEEIESDDDDYDD